MKAKNKDNKERITLDTYLYLSGLLHRERKDLKKNYLTACSFIPSRVIKRNQVSPMEEANEIFHEQDGHLKRMMNELHLAASAMYKDYPNKEMRKFWALEEDKK